MIVYLQLFYGVRMRRSHLWVCQSAKTPILSITRDSSIDKLDVLEYMITSISLGFEKDAYLRHICHWIHDFY